MSTEMKQTTWPDPTKVAGDVYKMVMVNDRVRVFDVRFKHFSSSCDALSKGIAGR